MGLPSAYNVPTETVVATVANGASLSGAVELKGAMLVGVQTPAAMDSATALTFQASYDSITFANFYDNSGTEYTVTTSTSRSTILPAADFFGVLAVKVRMGTAGSPVVASADRAFTLGKRP